jgi:hypothetical protein
MQEKLSEKEVVRLVAEVSKLDEEKRQSLDRDQVAEILREMDLPEEHLDEAMVRLRESKFKEKEQRRTAGLLVAVVTVAVIGIGAIMFQNTTYNAGVANITANSAHLSAQSATAAEIADVTAGSGTTFASVTLQNVPQGMRVPMRAKWIQPDGTIYHENRWQTKPADTATWTTHAKANIGVGAPKGQWTVEFIVGDRTVTTKKFVVN